MPTRQGSLEGRRSRGSHEDGADWGNDLMELRRATPRESRRRRVLVDESLRATAQTESRARKRRAPRYRPEALAVVHCSISTVIPTRPYWLCVVALCGLIGILSLVNLDLWLSGGRHVLSDSALRPLQLSHSASVGSWLSSLLLWSAAFYSLLIYSMRSHRMDDYRGRYRVWIGGVLLLAIGSMDQVTGVARGLLESLQHLPAAHPLHRIGWWLPILTPLLLAIPVLRLVWDLRDTRLAMGVAGLSALVALVVPSLWLIPLPPAWSDLGLSGLATLRLLAHWGLALASLLAARFVYLDAQGLVAPVRRARRLRVARPPQQSASAEADDDSADPPRRIWSGLVKVGAWLRRNDSGDPAPSTHHRSSVARPARESTSSGNDRSTTDESPDEYEETASERRNKTERRKLRKEKRRQQRAA